MWSETFAGKKRQMDVTEKCYTIVLLINRYRTVIYFCCIRKSLNNNNSGNFICVFECTIIIVNLATYRQFTNAAWDRIIEKKKKRKENQNCIKTGLSQFLFLQQKVWYVALMTMFIIFLIIWSCCFLSMPMPFTMSKTVEHSSEKTPRELLEIFTNFTHL